MEISNIQANSEQAIGMRATENQPMRNEGKDCWAWMNGKCTWQDCWFKHDQQKWGINKNNERGRSPKREKENERSSHNRNDRSRNDRRYSSRERDRSPSSGDRRDNRGGDRDRSRERERENSQSRDRGRDRDRRDRDRDSRSITPPGNGTPSKKGKKSGDGGKK